jgi:hypothetical protein
MSATQDESQDLDAGWDDEPSTESLATSEPEPSAEEIDGGWDHVPSDAPGGAPPADGQPRRRHRKRRPKSNALPVSSNPVLLPRPAEPTKKQQREHARQQRAHEAAVKQQRKEERKAQRAAEARAEAEERQRQAEAERLARQARQEARERARSERPSPKPAAPKPRRSKPSSAELKRNKESTPAPAKKSGLRPGVIITLVVLAAVVALLVLRK